MNTTASSARSRSASSNTITGFLPPSSKCTRFRVGAPCAMIAEPVALSPTKPIALMAGCSVSALPASSPMPCTVLSTPSGRPACLASLASRSAVTGDHSAGLCTTVQPAASAGAIFQVDSMNGVFHGVMTPTGPIGTRVEMFQCSSLGRVEAVARLGALVGEEAEILRAADRGLGHEAMGLAGVDAFQHGDIVGAVLDGVGDAMQQFLAHRRRHVAPGLEGACRRRGGAVDILGVAARDDRQHRAVDRRSRLERLRRRPTARSCRRSCGRCRRPSACFEQRRRAVAIGLKHVFRRGFIHGPSPLSGRRGCCCVSSWFPCR